jgi:ADP-heptose:LPS heptosyltransferase
LGENTQLNGYLKPDETRVIGFKKRLIGLGKKPLIGICWRSAFTKPVQFIYTKIDDLISFMPNENYSLISLQYGEFSDEVERIKQSFGVTINEIPDLDQIQDLDGVAALISSLDLVIAPSSTVLHLACALGVPTISTYYSNFRVGIDKDPLFGNCFPILRPGEVFSSSMIAKRTGEVVEYFTKFGKLPFNR